MPDDRLTPLQRRVLAHLVSVPPRWTLTGGAALAGFHTRDRSTRDLDLFFRSCDALGDHPATIVGLLVGEGLHVDVLQTSRT